MSMAWVAAYEKRRSSNLEGQNKALLSSKWDLESMSWDEIRAIPIDILGEGMTFGTSCEALRKSWYALKRNRAEGIENNRELEFRINRLQYHLGFERTAFDSLDQEWVDQELAMEEQQYKTKDEGDDGLADEGLSPAERQLNRQLRKEELGLDDEEEEEEEQDDDPW